MLRCWLLRQLQCKWDSNIWYCVSRYHSSLMTSFLEDIIPSWLNFQIAYVALLVAEAVTVQMRQQYVILCFKIPFLLDDIIPWRHHSFLIKIWHCLCCTVDWKHYIAYVALLVAEAVTVQMRQQYADIVFQDTIPPWRHHSFLIKHSHCICCTVGCWGSYSANETAICDIVFRDTIPPWCPPFLD